LRGLNVSEQVCLNRFADNVYIDSGSILVCVESGDACIVDEDIEVSFGVFDRFFGCLDCVQFGYVNYNGLDCLEALFVELLAVKNVE
jgi:hypothetical protein